MMRLWVGGIILAAGACQLADDIDAPKCGPGFHPELQKCVEDKTTRTSVTISAQDGGGCVVAPDLVSVKVAEDFQFDNADAVDHEVRGGDGTSWVTVPAGKLSPFVSIAKAGTWPYSVSGCADGGAVTVE